MNKWEKLISKKISSFSSPQGSIQVVPLYVGAESQAIRIQCRSIYIGQNREIDPLFKFYTNHSEIGVNQRELLNEGFYSVIRHKIKHLYAVFFFDSEQVFRGRWDPAFEEWKIISKSFSSPGFINRPLPVGEWKAYVLIYPHQIGKLGFELVVESSSEEPHSLERSTHFQLDDLDQQVEDNESAQWMVGELHEHSARSAEALPPEEVIRTYRDLGYQFIALTDHDIPPLDLLSEPPSIGLIRGQEIRSFNGHALLLGTKELLAWHVFDDAFELHDLIHQTHMQGGLFCALHPFAFTLDEEKVSWQWNGEMWASVDLIELWPGRWKSRFPEILKGLDFWDSLLDQGIRIYATCGKGSAVHMDHSIVESLPKTIIYSQGTSETHLLSALKQGRFYSSIEPAVNYWIESQQGKAMIGDELRLPVGEPYLMFLDVSLMDRSGFLKIKTNEGIYCEMPLSSTRETHIKFMETAKMGITWFRVEIYQYGRPLDELAAITNPIFIRGIVSY